jgi:predicted nucleotidyltransferase
MSPAGAADRSARARALVIACARELGATLLAGAAPLRLVLFGSRAAGTADARSDFDVGIEAAAPLPAATLTRIRERFDALDILQRVDVVDLRAADPGFAEVARAKVEVIFERQAD